MLTQTQETSLWPTTKRLFSISLQDYTLHNKMDNSLFISRYFFPYEEGLYTLGELKPELKKN